MSTRALRERSERLRADRIPFVHARVVLAERPTSAKPGDEALILADGTIEGFVGGQCSQSTVRAQGLETLASGQAMLLRIAPTPEPRQSGKTVVHNPCLSGGTVEIFMEPVLPAPLVRVLGDSPIAMAVASVGQAMGYELQIWGGEPLTGVDVVVLASHGLAFNEMDEEQALMAAVAAGVSYIGVVASPKRGAALLGSLDLTCEQRARIHAPAGLNIGARTPEEIALSIYAEVIELRGRVAESGDSVDSVASSESAIGSPTIAIDPICKMTVSAVESSIHADVDGRRWYFCCPGCRTAFLTDPTSIAVAQ